MSQLGRLTNAETLLIERRRKGENQHEAAARHQVSHDRYAMWERGHVDGAPRARLGELKTHERCLLYRRRAGFTQSKVAEDLECCRRWVNLMERGEAPVDTLVWYWEA